MIQLKNGGQEFETPEEIRQHMNMSQAVFADLLGMPLRTYETKMLRSKRSGKSGFRVTDLLAAKFVYSVWAGAEPFDQRLEHISAWVDSR